MKKLIYLVIFLFFVIVSIGHSQTPPHPNGGNAPANGNVPVGGAAPIQGSTFLLFGLGIIYGIFRSRFAIARKLATPFVAIMVFSSGMLPAQSGTTTKGTETAGNFKNSGSVNSDNSLCFDGINDYVTVPHHSSLNPGAGSSWTIEVWAKLENTSTSRTIIGKRTNGGNYTQVSLFKNGPNVINAVPGKRICFVYQQSAGSTRGCYTNSDIVDGNWHHIVAVADQAANTLRIYIDGVLQPTTMALNAGSWPDPSNPDPFFLGYANNGSTVTDGSMKEVRVWKSARTQTQINQYLYTGIPNPASETALKAYFPCDESSGQLINDNSAFGNNGMMGSTSSVDANDPNWCNLPSPQDGQYCLDFDGSNDYITVPANTSLNVSTSYTVETWFYRNSSSTNYQSIINKGPTGAASDIEIYAQNSTYNYWLTVVHNRGSSFDYAYWPTVPADRWVHIAVVYSGGLVKVYYDGIYQTPHTNDESFPVPNSGSNTMIIGYLDSWPSTNLRGNLDELQIWKTALTIDQIRTNMHRQLLNPTAETNLVAYYRFNQTSGTILGDLSSYGNNGTLTNMDPATDWIMSTAPIPYYTVADGAWETNSNWATGQNAPVNAWSRADVTHNLTLNSSKELIELNIASTGSIDIAQSKSLTVSDNLINQSGLDGLVLRSGTSGTATIIENDGVEATVERYFTGNTTNWHLVSSPVTAAQSGVFTGIYLQKFSETSNQYSQIIPTNVTLNPGQGFAAYSTLGTSNTVTFPGNLNAGTLSYPVTQTTTAPYGWNLVGNPYASGIDWNQIIPSLSGINNTIYYLESATGNWLSWNGSTGSGSRYIPPMQGFFVSASSNSNLVLTNSSRTHTSTGQYYKNSPDNLLVIKASGNGFEDKTYFSFNNDFTATFDGQTDGYKILSDYNDLLPQVYTFNENTRYSIDYRPEVDQVDAGFKAGVEGIYSIGICENVAFDEVWLEDINAGIFTDLKKQNYDFAFDPEAGEKPFILHFKNTGSQSADLKVYSSGNSIYMQKSSDTRVDVTLTDLSGRIISANTVINTGLNTVFSHLKAGIYLVKSISSLENRVDKVMIR